MRKNIGLFRGKCAEQWLYGYLTINGNGTCQIWENTDVGFFPAIVNPKTVGEFTGLTDKNGMRIFEGDLIAQDSDTEPLIVKYEDGIFIAELANRKDWIFIYEAATWEIVGNIYDNPEILGGNDHAAD